MVIVVIIACHYSTTISNMCGRKPVQVLATLFLLSYTKIIRVVITIFSYTVLIHHPDGLRKNGEYDMDITYKDNMHVVRIISS